MEIVLERIAKKNTYTIGRLYLLADGDENELKYTITTIPMKLFRG